MEIGTVSEWTDVAEQQAAGATEAGSDGCLATFYHRPMLNRSQSEIEGRPIYDSKDFVKIIIPGDNKNVVDRPVQDADKKRWPAAWGRFKAHDEGALVGTPIEQWAFLDTIRVAELKHLGIRTVEQIANVADDMLSKIGANGRDLRTRAIQYLSPQEKVETELRAQIGELSQSVTNLTAQLDEAQRQLSEKPRRGRPRKEEE